MATPIIGTLRRNQGYILAVMGVVLIITWVIGPAAIDYFGGGGGARGRRVAQPPVVQWNKAGTTQFLSDGDLTHLRQEHMAVLDFISKIVTRAQKDGYTPQAPGLNLTPNPQTGQISLGLPMDNSEATVVNILLFSERGRELGVRVDKQAMVEYLKGLSGHGLEEGDFVAIAQETVGEAMKSGRVLSVDSLFSALRKELAAQQAQFMLGSGVTNVSTGELWELHKQLNLRYKIEAYPIDVEKLKANFKTADAKPDELMAIFNKGKERVPNPDLPEPGFRIPHRIAFEYCTVDYEVFLAMAKKNVSEAAALERYKKGIEQGDFRKPKPLPDTTKEKPKEETTPDKPGEPKPGEPKPGEEKPAEPDKKDEAKPEEKPAEKPAEEKPAADAKPCDDEPAKETKPAETKDETKSEPGKSEPAKTEPAKETPPAGEKTEDPAKAEKTEPEVKEEIQHKTFAEVKDQILTELAQPEATKLRDEAVRNAIDELRVYSTKLARFEESKKDKQTGVENPGEFRPQAFAAKYKFAYGKTNLVDRHQAATTVLGQNAMMQSSQGSLMFSEFAFFQRANLYDPSEASSFGDTKYLYWRVADEAERAVELEKDGSLPPAVKAQVEQAWQKEKALEAAKKRAEDIVAKLKGSSLRDVVGKNEDGKVVQPIPFSMFTTNGQPLFYPFNGRPEYSQPNGIPMAGKEFMDKVFSLKPGESGVTVDQPHNVVYVVHVLGDEPSLEIRREMFLSALQRGQFTDLMGFATIEKRGDMQSLFDDLEKHFSVKWGRSPSFGGGGDE